MSKRAGEWAVAWSKIGIPIIVRPTNMYGPHDYFDDKAHVIPALIRKFIDDDIVHVYGKPNTTREFLYVEDAVEGMMAAAERAGPSMTYVLGTNGETRISIGDLVSAIAGIIGTSKEIVWHEGMGGGDSHRWTSNRLTQTELEWHHRTSLIEGLEKTISWYMESRNG